MSPTTHFSLYGRYTTTKIKIVENKPTRWHFLREPRKDINSTVRVCYRGVYQNWQNRPLPSSKNPHFQNEAKCTTFLVKMSFICMRMKGHFHIKSWVKSYRKWLTASMVHKTNSNVLLNKLLHLIKSLLKFNFESYYLPLKGRSLQFCKH